MQYPVSVPQSVVSQQIPQYVQSNMAPAQQTRLPKVPINQTGQSMVPTVPTQQQPLNYLGLFLEAKEQPREV